MNTHLSREDYITSFYANWLVGLADVHNRNAHCNLTVCPECGCDDFSHAEGCSILAEIRCDIGV